MNELKQICCITCFMLLLLTIAITCFTLGYTYETSGITISNHISVHGYEYNERRFTIHEYCTIKYENDKTCNYMVNTYDIHASSSENNDDSYGKDLMLLNIERRLNVFCPVNSTQPINVKKFSSENTDNCLTDDNNTLKFFGIMFFVIFGWCLTLIVHCLMQIICEKFNCNYFKIIELLFWFVSFVILMSLGSLCVMHSLIHEKSGTCVSNHFSYNPETYAENHQYCTYSYHDSENNVKFCNVQINRKFNQKPYANISNYENHLEQICPINSTHRIYLSKMNKDCSFENDNGAFISGSVFLFMTGILFLIGFVSYGLDSLNNRQFRGTSELPTVVQNQTERIYQIELIQPPNHLPTNHNIVSNLQPPKYQLIKHNLNYNNETCPICLDDFNIDKIVKNSENNEKRVINCICGHKFHEQCIKSWMNMKNTCPICKKVIAE